jgi:superfamily II DNA or RNA helicase
MTALACRDYQQDTIDAVDADLDAGHRRVAVVLPTGAGKTVVFSHLALRYLKANPGSRVLILAHTDELVAQAATKLKMVDRDLRVGIVKGPRNQVRSQVVVASVQTLRHVKRRAQLKRVGLIIVDECHHATANTYRAILEHFGALEPKDGGTLPADGAVAVGFTATLARGDSASLGEIWEKVSYRQDILFMIKRGYLLDVRGKRIEVPDLDLSQVRKTRSDYREGDLGVALTESMAPDLVAKAYIEHAADRSGVMFWPTVESATIAATTMREAGITCEVVHGGLEMRQRRAILARLESGETQVVANCMVLTEGFDSPRVSCVVIARPTRSAPLYQQMVGRALRVDPTQPRDGQDALVLDVVGASRAHDLRSLVDLSIAVQKVRDDQSLLEAEEEETEARERGETEYYRGPVEVKDFDPLARQSRHIWITTASGSRCLTAGTEEFVFLVSVGENAYQVAWCNKSPYQAGRGGFLYPDINGQPSAFPLEQAMQWAEQAADERGGESAATYGRKGRSWRYSKPTVAALGKARQEGVAIDPSWNAGQVSEAIDRALASQRVDQVVAAIVQMRYTVDVPTQGQRDQGKDQDKEAA